MVSRALTLVFGVLVTATSICAQQNPPVRVCVNVQVATLSGQIDVRQRVNPTYPKMQANALSEHKSKKANQLVLEGVVVPQLGAAPSGIPGRSPYEKYGSQLSDADLKLAQENHCDYVLFSLFTNTPGALGAVPHTAFPTPQQSLGAPYGGADTQAPEVAILVTYRLHKINPRAPVVEGSISAHDTAPAYGLTMRALDMVAAQVFEKIAKSGVTPAHTP